MYVNLYVYVYIVLSLYTNSSIIPRMNHCIVYHQPTHDDIFGCETCVTNGNLIN